MKYVHDLIFPGLENTFWNYLNCIFLLWRVYDDKTIILTELTLCVVNVINNGRMYGSSKTGPHER